MTNIQRTGILMLTVGSLLLLSAGIYWLAAPFFIPSSPKVSSVIIGSQTANSAPALSPYTAPVPTPIEIEPIVQSSESIYSISSSIAEDKSEQLVLTRPNTAKNENDKAVESRDSTQVNSSLRLVIPALDIDAPVLPVSLQEQPSGSRRPYRQWSVPDSYAVGWHDSSASPGQIGNTVLNGHNNVHGAVFANLVDLTLGEKIIIYKSDREYIYEVVHREFLPEQGEPLKTRLWNARWIAPSDDMRLTIVTCWPNSSNSHRLVVVAQPQLPVPG